MGDSMIDIINETVAKNEAVNITGFGKFEPRARKESERINPQTGKRINVPTKVVPAFKPGKVLRDVVGKKLKAFAAAISLRLNGCKPADRAGTFVAAPPKAEELVKQLAA